MMPHLDVLHSPTLTAVLCPVCGGPAVDRGAGGQCQRCQFTFCLACEGIALEIEQLSDEAFGVPRFIGAFEETA